MNHYGEKVKSHREKRGLSVNELAGRLDVSTQSVKKAEATGEFPISWLPKLAKEFKTSPAKLVRMSGRKKASKVVATAVPKIVKAAPVKKPKAKKPEVKATEVTPVVKKKRGRPRKVEAPPEAPDIQVSALEELPN